MAMLLITHDMGVVAEVADEVAVMRFGRIVERGPVDEIFHDARHPYTQQLLASTVKLDAARRRRLTRPSPSRRKRRSRSCRCAISARLFGAWRGGANYAARPSTMPASISIRARTSASSAKAARARRRSAA